MNGIPTLVVSTLVHSLVFLVTSLHELVPLSTTPVLGNAVAAHCCSVYCTSFIDTDVLLNQRLLQTTAQNYQTILRQPLILLRQSVCCLH